MGVSYNVPLREDQIFEKAKGEAEKQKIAALTSAINAETENRQNADTALQADIAALNAALSDEMTARTNADTALKQEYSTKITQEATRREQADAALQTALNNEIAVRNSQTSSLGSALQNEVTTRKNADTALQADINALNTALSNEITLRANDDYALKQEYSAKITQEATRREEGDAALQTALNNEISTRTAQMASLGSALQNEVTERNNADTALKSELNANIAREAELRTAEDNRINARIDELANSMPEQQSYKEFTPSTATADGAAGLVPAPPKGTETKVLTDQGWRELSSTDIFIGAVPTQNGQPSYTGDVIYPQWLNYDEQKLTIAGQISGTNAGTYTVTFTPKGLYCWSDGTRGARTATWQIYKANVPIPTAAITSYEYTGSNVTLSVTNFNSSTMTQAGTITAKNAGNYTATYKLKNTTNYQFADGSITDKNIQWNITAKKLAKPTASNTQFTYTGSAITLSVSNVDLTYMNKSGSDTATAAGTYSVTYTLKDTTNYQFSDGTTAAVTISWKINVLSIAKPTASSTSFEYTGSQINLSVTGYDAARINKIGDDSAINAGNYSVTYSLKDKTNTKWSDGTTADITLNWVINRKKLTAAQSTFSQKNTLTYDGNVKNIADNLNGYNAAYHDLTSQTSMTNAGTYTVKIAPKANYAFSDGTTAAKSVSWAIGKNSLAKPTAAKTSFDYDGSTKTLSVTNFDSSLMNKAGTDSASAAGNYSVTYTLKDTSNYQFSDGTTAVTINWEIANSSLAKPTASVTSFEYTGSQISLAITGYDASTMTKTGDESAINAGTYSVTIALKDKSSMKWADGSTADVVLTWQITRKKLTAAQSTFSQKNTLTYDGNAKNIADNLNGYNPAYHDLSSQTSMTNAGTYTVKIAPKANYAFSDGTTAAKSVSWTIDKKSVTKPTAAKTSFDYDGSVKTLSLSNYNSALMTKTGTVSESAKGSYTVTFTLNDTTNYQWEDNTSTPYSIAWSIGAASITKPTLSGTTSFTYDGNAKTVTVNGYDSNTMTFSGTISETNAGNYTAKYTLKDKTNTNWADGSTDDVILNWNIARKKLTAAQSNLSCKITERAVGVREYSASQGGGLIGSLACSGDDINNFDSTYHTITRKSATAGDFKTDVIFYCSVNLPYEDQFIVGLTSNYCWNDGSTEPKSFPVTVTQLKIPKPTAATTSFAYDGNTKTLTVNNFDATYMTQVGDLSGTNVGNYSVSYAFKSYRSSAHNGITPYVVWIEDNTDDDVILSWQITTGDGIVKPTLSKTEYEWSGGNISPSISGYNSSVMNQGGTFTASAIGTYNVTYSLKDKTNTKWADGTTADISFTWKIVRQKLTNDLAIDTATTLTYSGSVQEPKFKYGNVQWTLANLSQYCDLSSQTSAVDAGTYRIVVTPKSNYAFKDGTTAAKTYSWTIQKAEISSFAIRNKSTGETVSNRLSADSKTIVFPASGDDLIFNDATTLTFEYDGDATLAFCNVSGTILDNSKITTSGNTTTYDFSTDVTISMTGKDIIFNPLNYISSVITVYVRLVEGVNYAAPSRYIAAIRFKPQLSVSLQNCTWSQVKQIIQSGHAADVWEVGDYKVFDSNGGAITTELDGRQSVDTFPQLAMILIGIDHNSEIEGSKRAHFMLTHWTTTYDGDHMAALFTSSNSTFHMTPQSPYYGTADGYRQSYFRKVVADQFFSILPTELQDIITPTVKWAADRAESDSTTDNIFLLSVKEILPDYSDWGGINNVIYEYFANGNNLPLIPDKTQNVVHTVYTWARDYVGVTDDVAKFKAVIKFNGQEVIQYQAQDFAANSTYCSTYLPCFAIA